MTALEVLLQNLQPVKLYGYQDSIHLSNSNCLKYWKFILHNDLVI